MDQATKSSQPNSQKEQSPKQQVVEALKGASNVLITVSNNPTVDQLAACIGLTLMMNKLDKHATAVFSGQVPSTLEFLEPEKTIEANTDSLRDFIISLDKSKADKLRYKVEDEVVRIYITPYRTSIGEADLDFTQGDFNVDVVVALGIDNKDQLDSAIIEHGQILHDATIIDMSFGDRSPVDMGTINWHEPTASSLSEMLVSISEAFQSGLLDTQMATAFLTGIVAETDRFSNDKTTPKTMTMSAQLMAAGANQQLIANQLAIQPEPQIGSEPMAETSSETAEVSRPGELDIPHDDEPKSNDIEASDATVEQGSPSDGLAFSVRDEPKAKSKPITNVDDVADSLGASGDDVTSSDNKDEKEKGVSPIEIDEQGKMVDLAEAEADKQYAHHQKVIQPINQPEPPQTKTDLSSYVFDNASKTPLTANTVPESQTPEPSTDPLSVAVPVNAPMLNHNSTSAPTSGEERSMVPPDAPPTSSEHEQTLAELEKAVDSPHVSTDVTESGARSAVEQAMAEAGYVPDKPIGSVPPADVPVPDPSVTQNTQSLSPPPPEVPPPFVPPYMQPSTSQVSQTPSDDELGLPPSSPTVS